MASKFNSPKIPAYADNEGFIQEDLSKFGVNDPWGIILPHSLPGNLKSHVHRPVIR